MKMSGAILDRPAFRLLTFFGDGDLEMDGWHCDWLDPVDYLAQYSLGQLKRSGKSVKSSKQAVRETIYRGFLGFWNHRINEKPMGRFASFALFHALADCSLIYFLGEKPGLAVLSSHLYWGARRRRGRKPSFSRFREMVFESYDLRMFMAKRGGRGFESDLLRRVGNAKFKSLHRAAPLGLLDSAGPLFCGTKVSREDLAWVEEITACLRRNKDMTRFLAQLVGASFSI